MSTRIKYIFEGPIGISRQVYGTKSGAVRIVINKQDFTFEIVDATNNTMIVQGGNTKNYAVLLRQAKRALVNLGADFSVEERNRDYGVVRKRTKKVKRILSKRSYIKILNKLTKE